MLKSFLLWSFLLQVSSVSSQTSERRLLQYPPQNGQLLFCVFFFTYTKGQYIITCDFASSPATLITITLLISSDPVYILYIMN